MKDASQFTFMLRHVVSCSFIPFLRPDRPTIAWLGSIRLVCVSLCSRIITARQLHFCLIRVLLFPKRIPAAYDSCATASNGVEKLVKKESLLHETYAHSSALALVVGKKLFELAAHRGHVRRPASGDVRVHERVKEFLPQLNLRACRWVHTWLVHTGAIRVLNYNLCDSLYLSKKVGALFLLSFRRSGSSLLPHLPVSLERQLGRGNSDAGSIAGQVHHHVLVVQQTVDGGGYCKQVYLCCPRFAFEHFFALEGFGVAVCVCLLVRVCGAHSAATAAHRLRGRESKSASLAEGQVRTHTLICNTLPHAQSHAETQRKHLRPTKTVSAGYILRSIAQP
jgi:hypothetical protein